MASLAAADGKVYIGTIEGIFYCLNAVTGEVIWKYDQNERSFFHEQERYFRARYLRGLNFKPW